MLAVTLVAALAILAAFARPALWRQRRLADEVALLAAQVRDLASRLEVAEEEAARALAAAEVAGSVLVEKGVADEEDLEAARPRSGSEGASTLRARDGGVH